MKANSVRSVWLIILSVIFVILIPVSITAEETASADNISMIVPTGEAASYWTRWRGTSGQGLVAGVKYTDTWSGVRKCSMESACYR